MSATSQARAQDQEQRERRAGHQWRGVIEEYRDLLEIPPGTPAVTLREGGDRKSTRLNSSHPV